MPYELGLGFFLLLSSYTFETFRTEKMEADSSNAEHTLNRHALSFQSAAINSSTSEVIPMANYNYYGMNVSTIGLNMIFPGNSSMIADSSGLIQAGNSSTSLLLDSLPGLTHDTGLAAEWSVEEQYKLEEGLANYADEPNIMKYVKIASTLADKTVRDVAMRCRWMARKRRKSAEYHLGKKVNNRKDKLVEFNSKMNLPLVMPRSIAAYPLTMNCTDQNGPISFEVLGISGKARHLLEQNAQAFSQITANLSTFKLQDNIELFCHLRNNITTILNDMRHMPGIMSQMPHLPISINEDLANSILPRTTQSIMLSSPIGIQLKQEPRCR